MSKTLEQVRVEQEGGLTPLAVINLEPRGCVLVILEGGRLDGSSQLDPAEKRRYHCHRYFDVLNDWVCSVDGAYITLEAVFSWLDDPGYIYPEAHQATASQGVNNESSIL